MDNRLFLAAVTLVLLAPTAFAAGDPGLRSEPLATESAVQDVAVASGGSRIMVGAADPSRVDTGGLGGADPTTPADMDVWFLFNADGSLSQAGSADLPVCVTCQASVRAVAISTDGRRAVAGSAIDGAESDTSSKGRLVFVTSQQGQRFATSIAFVPDQIHMNEAGTDVFVVGTPEALSSSTIVQWYTWSDTGVVAMQQERQVSDRIDHVARSNDGVFGALGGSDLHFLGDGHTITTASDPARPVTALAVYDKSPYWTVAGTDQGHVALFSEEANTVQLSGRRPARDPVRSVAIHPEGTSFVSGDEQGRIHFFDLDIDQSGATAYRGTDDLGSGAISHLQYDASGSLLLLTIGDEIRMYEIAGTDLRLLWEHDAGATIDALAMDASGDLVAAAAGGDALVFDALRNLKGAHGGGGTVSPKESREVEFRLQHPGNRPVTVALGVSPPPGWAMLLDKQNATLYPGETVRVKGTVVVAKDAPPGTHDVQLVYTYPNGTRGNISVPFTVPEVFGLAIVGPTGTTRAAVAGAPTETTLQVQNTGNTQRQVTVQTSQPGDGWTAGVEPSSFTLAAGASQELALRVQAPSGVGDGTSKTVTVSLAEDAEASLELTFTVGAAFGVEAEAPAGIVAIIGNETRATVTIRNPGNAPDTYNIELLTGGLPAGWSALLENSLTQMQLKRLGPGETQDIGLRVHVPEDATADQSVSMGIRVTSAGDPAKQVERTIVVTSAAEAVPTPTTTKTPGIGWLAAVALVVAAAFRGNRND